MTTLRAVCILAVFILVTLALLPLQWVAVSLHLPARRRIPNRYHRFVCRLFGLRIFATGAPVGVSVLMAANHTGWLDIPILSALAPVSFVAKSEVGTWPFFGALARAQRTIFIHRERSGARQARDNIRKRLLDGDALVLFPEGTSSDGNRVLPFRSALLSAAELDLGEDSAHRPRHARVQPVSIAYVGLHGIPMGRENRPFFAWYGDMELVSHLWEALRMGPIDVMVEFHKPTTIDETGGRKALAAHCETVVRAGLIRALTGFHVEPQSAQADEALIEALDDAESEEAA